MSKNTYTVTNNTAATQGFFQRSVDGDDNSFGEHVLIPSGESRPLLLSGMSLKQAQQAVSVLPGLEISKGDKAADPAPAPAPPPAPVEPPADDQGLLTATSGAETLIGGQGNDLLSGDLGLDTLAGSAAEDTLIGGQGDDTLRGGGAEDTDPRSDDALREYILEKTGKPAHHNAKRKNLLVKVAEIDARAAATTPGPASTETEAEPPV